MSMILALNEVQICFANFKKFFVNLNHISKTEKPNLKLAELKKLF